MIFTKALSPALREIRILCSQTGPASAGTRSANDYTTIGQLLKSVYRQFIISKYPIIKKHNPDLPVLIREAQGTPARVFARFGACQQYRSFHSILTGRIRTWCRETYWTWQHVGFGGGNKSWTTAKLITLSMMKCCIRRYPLICAKLQVAKLSIQRLAHCLQLASFVRVDRTPNYCFKPALWHSTALEDVLSH